MTREMKRILKQSLKAAWRATAFLRRPLITRFEAMITRAAARSPHTCHVALETSVLMDHLVRELARLQDQIELLRETVERQATESTHRRVSGSVSRPFLHDSHTGT